MKLILSIISLAWAFSIGSCAPAVSSVHVSFVSGNKATQYSHGIVAASSPLLRYNLVPNRSHGDSESRPLRKRSIGRQRDEELRRLKVASTLEPVTMTSVTEIEMDSTIPKLRRIRPRAPLSLKLSTSDINDSSPSATNPTTTATASTKYLGIIDKANKGVAKSPSILRKMMRSRVEFVDKEPSSTTTKSQRNGGGVGSDMKKSAKIGLTMTSRMSGSNLLTELEATTVDALKATDKPKAVKRSPFLSENFDGGAITFPDFDEFGGDEFGSLRNFAGAASGGGRGSAGSHTHLNPEALSPDGVFLPPLPTEASDYADNDPYLADPDTAKYASQHPPFFAAFPHKRAVLALNDHRESNGLEPNILRSIRPFFAFFETSNHHSRSHSSDLSHVHHHTPLHHSPRTYYDNDNEVIYNLDPNLLLYAETHTKTQPITSSWSIFGK